MAQQLNEANKAVLSETPARDGRPAAVYRSAGDRFLMVEFGEMDLDLTLNFRVLGLNQAIKRRHRDDPGSALDPDSLR